MVEVLLTRKADVNAKDKVSRGLSVGVLGIRVLLWTNDNERGVWTGVKVMVVIKGRYVCVGVRGASD